MKSTSIVRHLAASLVLAAAAHASAQTVLASSQFPISNEGWQTFGAGGLLPADHVPLALPLPGGVASGGYLRNLASSTQLGFQAPGKFLGDQSAALGGQLSFRMHIDNAFGGNLAPVPVTLEGGGLSLSRTGGFVTPAWSTFVLDLSPGLWTVWGDGLPPRTATWNDFSTVLGDMSRLAINGNLLGPVFATTSVTLDDVFLTAPVPEPGTWALMSAGALALGLMATRRRQVGPD